MAEIELQVDLGDMLEALAVAGAEFVLIGGWALAVHGYGRGTDDLDILVRPSPKNAKKVVAALQAFGAPLLQHGVDEQTFATPGAGYRIGIKPNLIEILTEISGVTFDDVWADKITIVIRGHEVSVIGRRSLLANKRAAGRAKDLADVEWLERTTSEEGTS